MSNPINLDQIPEQDPLSMNVSNLETPVSKDNSKVQFYFLLTLTTIFWGTAFPFAKIVANELPPATAAAIRFLIALPFFFILAKVMEGKVTIPREDHWMPLLYGLLQITAYNYFFFRGLQYTTSSNSVLIISSGPAIVAVIAAIIYKDESLNLKRGLGVFLAFSGVAVIVLSSASSDFGINYRGDGITFLAALSFAIYTLFSKVVLKKMSPLQLTAWGTFYGVIGLLILATPEDPNFTISAKLVGAMLFLSIFAGVFGFLFYNVGAKTIGPTKVAIFINLVPLFGVLTSVIILGEVLTLWHFVAFLLIVAGIYLVNKKS